MTKNKKAQLGEGVLWVYRFILITLIAIVYTLVLSNLLYTKYDIRQAESVLLAKRITNCLVNNGMTINENFNNEALKKCAGLDVEKEKADMEEYYISAKLKYGAFSLKTETGNSVLAVLCDSEGKNYVCLSQAYYVLAKDKNNEIQRAKLDLLVAISKADVKYYNV